MRRGLRVPARALSAPILAAAAVWLGQACTNTDVTSVTIATVTVSPASATLLVGESRQFTADVRDVDGTAIPGRLVTWSSSNESIASVSSDGRATALQAGSAQVRATVQGTTGTAALTIEHGPIIVVSAESVSLFALRQGADPDPVEVAVDNGGNGGLTGLSASATYAAGEASGWLGLTLSSTAAPATLTISAAIGSLAMGTYHATVTLHSAVAEADVQIQVELSVTEDRPILRLTPTAIGFAGVAGSQPPSAQDVQVTNGGGGDLTGLTATVSYDGAGGWLTAELSSTTAPSVLTLQTDPTDLTPGSYQATVRVASPVAANAEGSVSVSFAVDAEPLADLSVAKTGPDQATQGDTVPFLITVRNNGPRDAVSVVVVDSLPRQLGFVRASNGGLYAGGAITWPGGILAAGGTLVDTLWVTADSLGTPTNVARVSSVTKDPSPGDHRTLAPIAVLSQPADLAVTKIGPATATAGAQVTYLIDVAHVGGPVDALGVVVTDVLPPGLTFVSATGGGSYDGARRTVTWSLPDIAAGGRTGFNLTAGIGPDVAGPITNVATVATLTRDPNSANDQATHLLAISRVADLALAKTGPASAAAGERITYGIQVDHVGGLSAASGVVVKDVLPATLSFVSATGGGVYDATDRTVTWSLGDVAIGATTALGLTVDVGRTVTGAVANTAVVSATSTDSVAGNNTSTVTTTVSRIADVAVSKTGPATAPAGTQITYSIAVAHAAGTSDASGVAVTDVLPAGLTFVSATGGGTYDAPSRRVTWTVGELAVGTTVPLSVVADVAPTASGEIVNTASVTSTSSDPVPTNDTSSLTTTIVRTADLEITKSAPATAVAGTQITYAITVKHVGGTVDAAGVVVTDPLPAGVTFVSATGGGTVTGGTVTWSLGGIAVGGSLDVSVTVALGAGTIGVVGNTATVSATSADPTPGNDTSTATTTVTQVADLSIDKAGPASAPQGSNVTYTLTVTNTSTSSGASGVVVADVLPVGLEFVSASGDGTLSGGTVTWSIGAIAPLASAARTLTVKISASATGTISNTATVTSTSTDPNPANDSDVVVTAITPATDLSVTKMGPDTTVVAGRNFDYTMDVMNNSATNPASGITLTDVLPSTLTFVSSNPGGTYDPPTRTVTWDVATLGLSGTFTRVLTVKANADVSGTVSNTATLTSATTDPDATNNTSTVNTTVRQEADLSIAVSGPATATAGDDVTYTIELTNTGPSNASGVTITDVLPAGLTFVSATGGGTPSGGTVTWTVASLAPGAVASVQVAATVGAGVTGDVVNTASVAGTTPDPNAANDVATATTTVSPPPALLLEASFGDGGLPHVGPGAQMRAPVQDLERRRREAMRAPSVYARGMKAPTTRTQAQPTRENEDRLQVLRAGPAAPR